MILISPIFVSFYLLEDSARKSRMKWKSAQFHGNMDFIDKEQMLILTSVVESNRKIHGCIGYS